MEATHWWLLVTVLMLGAHSLAHADQGASDAMEPSPQDDPPRPSLPCHKISVGNIDFAFSLYRQLAQRTPGENILFSPISISTALATLFLQAPAASRALLLEGLAFNLTRVPEAEIQAGFHDLLLQLQEHNSRLLLNMGQRRFSGLSLGLPQDLGEAQKNIAEYIQKQTQGRLGAWGEDLRGDTAAVLVNHLLLKAKWAQLFDSRATSLREFFVDERRAVQVPMMKQKAHHRLHHDRELQCTVLQMDHTGNTTSYFVFPKQGQLKQLEGALLPETLIKWDSLLRTREVDFYFPKFSISSTFRLEALLPQAAVGGGPGQPMLNISKVTHRAVMTLEEEGLEGAAATSVQLTPRPRPLLATPTPPTIKFNRPFLLFIFNTETGSLLFMGKVMNPLGVVSSRLAG